MPYMDWLPMVVCVVFACVWLAGCTLGTSGAATQQDPPTPQPHPQMTLTVRLPVTRTPLPTRQPPARIAAQPTEVAPPDTYTVEEDDTLLEIAISFDITVEALLAANPGIDPLALQIGQELTIPQDGTPATTVQQPPPPLPITVPTCHPTTTDSLVCLGLVENDQTSAAVQVAVAVQLTDREGGVLAEGETVLEQRFVRPGERAPYRVLFPGLDEGEVAGVVAGVSGGSLSDTVDDRYVAVVAENIETTVLARRYSLHATLTNPTETAAAPPRVVLTVLDADGTVYGYRVWDAPAPLGPGEQNLLDLAVLPLGLNGTSPKNLTHTLHIEAVALQDAS